MKIAIVGYGKMGREIERAAQAKKIEVGAIFDLANNAQGSGLTPAALAGIDVCIDFSTPDAAPGNIAAAARAGKNIVVGTTGWQAKLGEVSAIVRERKTALLHAANFSLGMNVFMRLAGEAARLFDAHEMYDAAISEIHHRGKADSPSGTALALGKVLLARLHRKKELLAGSPAGAIGPGQLQIVSSRIGAVAGTHVVTFDSEADAVELVHTAKNRSGFALGALVAAGWLQGKQGIFTMEDLFA